MRDDPMTRGKILVAHKNRIFLDALTAACAQSRLEVAPLDTGEAILSTLADTDDFAAIILDYHLIEEGGISALESLIENPAGLPVLIFGGTIPDWLLRLALNNGLMGVIPENMRLSALPSLLDVVLSGVVYAAPHWLREADKSERATRLSPREDAAVCRASAGQTNAQIAIALGCNLATVKGLMRSAGRKLGAVSRVQTCVAYAKIAEIAGPRSVSSADPTPLPGAARHLRENPSETQRV
ncbi:LuxR C-terminal-related transcriptional regulator [Rhodobacter maris]|uniref:DNA-binding NarL/FixJ family response regulator n=1 Tax=Rhodobacter maris TaxID=446682 RepID=A0A285TGC4_9RHOB|nr:LuxR C-terminal-related transcriptional regulator [Rhodobacter maris]SOC21274.1 DNA-binding NarL/FixJ family response regulator [Rhodobacter maris]